MYLCLFCCILQGLPKDYECNIGVLLKFGMLLIIYMCITLMSINLSPLNALSSSYSLQQKHQNFLS